MPRYNNRRPVISTRWIPRSFRVASLLMLLVAVALLATIITMHFAIHGAEVQVPALKSMTVADARRETAGLGLNFDIDNRYYSGEVTPGHILTQSPSPGTIVRRGWTVRVSESLGPQKVDVPETVGDSERLAELKLRQAGLEIGAVAQLSGAGAAEGTVLAQDPPPHAQDIEKPAVNLLISSALTESPDGWVMPDFTGWTLRSAQAALAHIGIKAATPDFINVATPPTGTGNSAPLQRVKPGSIVAQDPVSGMRVDQNTVVHLAVAK
jgi:eukaryotic-like serine/threonine-protein kinase